MLVQRLQRQFDTDDIANLHGLTKWLVWEWDKAQLGEPTVRDVCERAARRMKASSVSPSDQC